MADTSCPPNANSSDEKENHKHMTTIKRRKAQLSVAAVAALAIFAVAAVMLLAGSAPAQATTAAISPDDGAAQPRPQQTDKTPRHPAPPACPGETGNTIEKPARVVDSGHVALFDVWWNPDEGELTNSSCPPTVTHVPAVPATSFDPATPARDDRAASNTDIDKTIIHIPSSAKVNLGTSTIYTNAKYPQLWDADALENRDTNGDGVPVEGKGDRFVWVLPACPPDGSAGTNDLCLMFSAALLKDADWIGNIEYLVDHIHQIDTDKQDPRYTVAYGSATGDDAALWDSSDARVVTVPVAAGGYTRPTWFFTDRGTYELQVHIRGNPKTERTDGLKPVSENASVTSDVRTYIIHVGAEADLSVGSSDGNGNQTLFVENSDYVSRTFDPGDNAVITVVAKNSGPDDAPQTSVDVALSSGMTYLGHAPDGDTFADDNRDGVLTWDVGNLPVGTSKKLRILAKIGSETHGQTLTATATISATEPARITGTDEDGGKVVRSYKLPMVDPTASNDTGTGTFTVTTAKPNTDPMFRVTRSVAERSSTGTKVGDPIEVDDPDDQGELAFNLTGIGAEWFDVIQVSGGAQITVAGRANLDYELKSMYNLVLEVSDGKDANGNLDKSVDHTIRVLIKLTDVVDAYSVTLRVSNASPRIGETVTFYADIQNPPVPAEEFNHFFAESFGEEEIDRIGSSGVFRPISRTKGSPGTYTYVMEFWQSVPGDSPGADPIPAHEIRTNTVTVTWSNPE